jgi:hypothetical protein
MHFENDASMCMFSEGNTLSIYFEWSNGSTDWKNNFDFPAKPYRKMGDVWFCHRGFLKVWKSIEPHLVDCIMDPKFEVIHITGYSHGGAIAQLCYEYVRFHRPDVVVTGIGYGAPRVVWGPVRKAVKDRFAGFLVVKNGRDIVTTLPPKWLGFRNLGSVLEVNLGSKGPIDDHRPENYREMLSKIVAKS